MPKRNASWTIALPACWTFLKTNAAGQPGAMKNSASDRLACVDLPAFPLQLLLKRHPEWSAYPAAVVAEDKPQGLILQVNENARRFGVLPGLRYAAGFSLARGLRAGEV